MNRQFRIRFKLTNKLSDGIYKTTICQILAIYEYRGKRKAEVVSEGQAHWNNEADKYNEKIGKLEALKRAFNNLSEDLKLEFDESVGI